MEKKHITTQEEARQYAISWQRRACENILSYSDIIQWQAYFSELANKFDLVEEFTENGIL